MLLFGHLLVFSAGFQYRLQSYSASGFQLSLLGMVNRMDDKNIYSSVHDPHLMRVHDYDVVSYITP